MQAHIDAMSKAKLHLMSRPDTTFFATIVFGLKFVWDENIPTACTNGKEIRFSPAFFMSLDIEERIFLILHEALHCAYLHMERLSGRDHARWNMATDYVINLILVKRGFKMPKMGLLDHAYDGMAAEEVYPLIPESKIENFKASGGIDLDDSVSQSELDEIKEEIDDLLVRAKIQSEMAQDKPGTIPGDIQIYLNKLLNPKLPWQQILRRFFKSMSQDDYTMSKPNRRFFPKYHLPTLHSDALVDLAIAVDISGSVSDADFKQMISDIASVLRMMKPKKITLIQFDTRITNICNVRNIKELMQVKFVGRGGTEIGPVIEWANVNKPEALLIFTDGGFYFRGHTTKIPTVWLIHNNPQFVSEFGKIIHYEMG